jgi:hypothetical protein
MKQIAALRRLVDNIPPPQGATMFKKIFVLTAICGILLAACASRPLSTPDPDRSVDSSGNTVSGAPGSSDPGSTTGGQAEPNPGSAPDGPPMPDAPLTWISYTDPAFGFSLTYPDLYTILKEKQPFSAIAPTLLGRFRLLETEIANSEFAEMDPPKFSLEIYANPGGLTLDKWIAANAPGSGDLQSVQVDGMACSQLTLRIEIAPNQFIFCSKGDKVFKFTPLGPHALEILASFKFNQP